MQILYNINNSNSPTIHKNVYKTSLLIVMNNNSNEQTKRKKDITESGCCTPTAYKKSQSQQ